MIEITSVSKYFGSLAAVDHLDLTFRSGVTGLVGHNGAGKSTLFRLISGVYQTDGGSILIDGLPFDSVEAKEKLFYLSDDPYGGGDYREVYDFYSNFYDIDFKRYEGLLRKFGLPLDKQIRTFSKGMRRQLFICLTLSVKVDNYLLDEAFDGIDPLVQVMIKEELDNLSSEGKTIVISGHNLLGLEKLADRYVILYKGRLAKEGEDRDLGKSLIKFQCMPSAEFGTQELSDLGFEVISFKKVGSIVNFVITEKEGAADLIKEKLNPTLLEEVALAQDEVVTMQMKLAREKGEDHE